MEYNAFVGGNKFINFFIAKKLNQQHVLLCGNQMIFLAHKSTLLLSKKKRKKINEEKFIH